MIERNSILEWSEQAPWTDLAMVEQDLIICRALVDIFSDDFLREQLAFRGGTALHKLYLQPQHRFSEDIDLVQIHPGPIKPILFRLGEVLSWMPDRVIKQKRYNNTLLFRMESEFPPIQPIRLKVEINCYAVARESRRWTFALPWKSIPSMSMAALPYPMRKSAPFPAVPPLIVALQ